MAYQGKKMEWAKLLSSKRYGIEEYQKDERDARTPYEKDADRIIFSSSFRRLSYKTQVHSLVINDHVHTRLTHSLEVAQVGRSLGYIIGKYLEEKKELPEGVNSKDIGDIVLAACLAHDIGTPPFGHPGEKMLREWFDDQDNLPLNAREEFDGLSDQYKNDLKSFDANAQGFRWLVKIENNLWKGGLQLTYATLGAFLKYPYLSTKKDDNGKFGAYLSESNDLKKVAEELGLIPLDQNKEKFCRHPLSFLVEAADDICYATIDLEDAVELKIITFGEAYECLSQILPEKDKCEIENNIKRTSESEHRRRFAILRGKVYDILINSFSNAFISNEKKIMEGSILNDLLSTINEGDPVRNVIEKAKKIGREKIYKHQENVAIEMGGFEVIDNLLRYHVEAVIEKLRILKEGKTQKPLKWRSRLILDNMGEHAPTENNAPNNAGNWSYYDGFRRCVDFVSGMTDRYAIRNAKILHGMIERSV